MDCSPPDSSLHGISQARILEQVTISFLKEFSLPGNRIHSSHISCNGRWILYHWAAWEAQTEYCSVQMAGTCSIPEPLPRCHQTSQDFLVRLINFPDTQKFNWIETWIFHSVKALKQMNETGITEFRIGKHQDITAQRLESTDSWCCKRVPSVSYDISHKWPKRRGLDILPAFTLLKQDLWATFSKRMFAVELTPIANCSAKVSWVFLIGSRQHHLLRKQQETLRDVANHSDDSVAFYPFPQPSSSKDCLLLFLAAGM